MARDAQRRTCRCLYWRADWRARWFGAGRGMCRGVCVGGGYLAADEICRLTHGRVLRRAAWRQPLALGRARTRTRLGRRAVRADRLWYAQLRPLPRKRHHVHELARFSDADFWDT